MGLDAVRSVLVVVGSGLAKMEEARSLARGRSKLYRNRGGQKDNAKTPQRATSKSLDVSHQELGGKMGCWNRWYERDWRSDG